MTQQINLNLVSEIDRLYRSNYFVARLDFKAYTPWAGGCSTTETIRVRNGHVIDVCLPEAKHLVGRARWLARIAAATVLGGAKEYKDVENASKTLLGSTNSASPFTITVTPHVSRVQLVKQLDRALTGINWGRVELNDLLGRISQAFKAKGFRELARNVRLNLMVRGRRGASLAGVIPLPPEAIKGFTVEVYRRPGNSRNTLQYVPALLALLAVTPLLAGLGKMTSRGFGRFCLDRYWLAQDLSKQTSSKAISILKLAMCNSLEHLDERKAVDTIWSLLEGVGILLVGSRRGAGHSQTKVPVASPDWIKAVTVKGTITDALTRIAKATTKQCWKRLLGLNIKSPGANIHTWILGLPRLQESGGYALLNIAQVGDVRCVSARVEKRIGSRTKIRPPGIEGRRLSSIHTFPLPSRGTTTVTMVVGYKAYDFVSLLSNEQQLYHVGSYFVGRDRGRMSFEKDSCQRYHVVRVMHLAQLGQRDIPNPCGRDCRTVGHKEKAGVLTPQGHIVAVSRPKELVDVVFEAALELIATAIARGC